MFHIKPGYAELRFEADNVTFVEMYDGQGCIMGSHVKVDRFPVRNIYIWQ